MPPAASFRRAVAILLTMACAPRLAVPTSVRAVSSQTAAAGDGAVRPWYITQRVDDRRIVVLFGGHALYLPQRDFEQLPVRATTRSRTPGRLFDVPADRVPDIVGDKARVGDRWMLDAGRKGRFHFTVDQFVLGYKDCGEAWGILATIAADEAAAFASVVEKYYLARLERPGDTPPAKTTLGPIAFSLDRPQRDDLAALLERERIRTWPAIRAKLATDYARAEASEREPYRKWPARWKRFDAALDRGEAKLTFDMQAFRLTPDGEPRLYVRARWQVGGQFVYAISAWVRVSAAFVVDRVDADVSYWMRMPNEYIGVADTNLGLVLNVVDTDGDGYAEILLMRAGYESLNVDIVDTPGVSGQRRDPFINYSNGC